MPVSYTHLDVYKRQVYESSYDFDYSTYSYNTTTTGYDGEGQITSALDYVLNDDMPKVYTVSYTHLPGCRSVS